MRRRAGNSNTFNEERRIAVIYTLHQSDLN